MKHCPDCLKPSRRDLLTGVSGLTALAALVRRGDAQVDAGNVKTQASAKACIFINLDGAPSHLDTFDVKDGEWNAGDADIHQLGPGLLLNRVFFPELSRHASRVLLLHSVASWEAAHDRGQFYLQTAHPANPAFVAETPNIGAVVSLESTGAGVLPPFLSLNQRGGSLQGATFLGGRFEPMAAPAGPFTTIQHSGFGAQGQARFEARFSMLRELEGPMREQPSDPALARHLAFYDAAKPLMYNAAVDAVFRTTAEEVARYGGTDFARSCIVARNAVRARNGAAFLTIRQSGWDTHQNMLDQYYTPNMYTLTGELDRGVGMLATDLAESGHLDETLIVIMGEFGRTPGPLNARGGRDHHKDAMSVAMLGGGVRGGRGIGATDSQGGQIVEPGWRENRPIYIEDITATIYSALGINWTKRIAETPTGRIFEYVPGSRSGAFTAVREVFA